MIPASVAAQFAAFQAAVKANAPLASVTPYQLAVLVQQGQAALSAIDAALADAGAPLDAADPTGNPVEMIASLSGRLDAASDQVVLADMRGYVGRALLNLAQGTA